jgi:hypothetical protein
MLRRVATAVALAACVAGCASREMVSFRVESDPSGAPVEVDGVSMGTTPTTIQLGASKRWVGVVNSPDGWEYDRATYAVTVFPPRGFSGVSQTKRISPATTPQGGRLLFDLHLDPVTPRQRIQIR